MILAEETQPPEDLNLSQGGSPLAADLRVDLQDPPVPALRSAAAVLPTEFVAVMVAQSHLASLVLLVLVPEFLRRRLAQFF